MCYLFKLRFSSLPSFPSLFEGSDVELVIHQPKESNLAPRPHLPPLPLNSGLQSARGLLRFVVQTPVSGQWHLGSKQEVGFFSVTAPRKDDLTNVDLCFYILIGGC